MYKLIIADDEARIRRGLRNCMDWKELNIEIVGEAADGEIALELAKEFLPDIMLVDINMPFLSGLELVKELKDVLENCIIIIITGYDEFKYTREALKLKVFDYILKPVNVNDLRETIIKGIEELDTMESNKNYFNWASKQLDDNLDSLRQAFLNNWLNGNLSYEEVLRELSFFKINLKEPIGIMVMKTLDKVSIDGAVKNWDKDLLYFAIINMTCDLLSIYEPIISFIDESNNIIIISPINHGAEWLHMGSIIEEKVNSYLRYNLVVEQSKVINGIASVKDSYAELIQKVNRKFQYKPVVLLTMKYIDSNYFVNDLGLEEVAKQFNVSHSYLSKLLKQETGFSFVDYLTCVRIKKAINLMQDPTIKVYEVAELVGYNNQHYFSKAFKKVMGLSPVEYRGGRM